MLSKPILAVTMGDPAGIGPEICVRAWQRMDHNACIPLFIGDVYPMQAAMRLFSVPETALHIVQDVSGIVDAPDVLNLYPVGAVSEGDYALGQVSAAAGHAAFEYVRTAIDLAMKDLVDGTVTAPLNKEALHLAGHNFAGHTEIYAHFTGCSKYAMMLAQDDFRLIHVSTHVSLREACDRVKKDRVLEVIELAHQACQAIGIEHPRVGVAGLNPHCGEGGLFGREEIDEIRPAVELAQQKGILADGPIPPDTIFSKMRGGLYDICVAMYHDQGHIPIKLIGFVYDPVLQKWQSVDGVNITLGLPIVRVSVDHGTAFDIAGKGVASPASMLSAIDYALKMALTRRNQNV